MSSPNGRFMGERKSCFVIMPITTPPGTVAGYGGDDRHFEHVLDHLVGPAVEAEGFSLIRPLVDNSEVIQGEIIRHLAHADLVLCDITGWNANVFFELGIRVALDLPVAMIRDDRTNAVPFDNNMVSCHTYGAGLELWTIADEIERLRRHIRTAAEQKRNAMWKYFGIATVASLADSTDPVEAKLDMLLSEMQKRQIPPAAAADPPRLKVETLPSSDRVTVHRAKLDPDQARRQDAIAAHVKAQLPSVSGRVTVTATERSGGRYSLVVGLHDVDESQQEEVQVRVREIVALNEAIRDVEIIILG